MTEDGNPDDPAPPTGYRDRSVPEIDTSRAHPARMYDFLLGGSGLPTASNVHQVARAVAPDSRVVYVGNDRSRRHRRGHC